MNGRTPARAFQRMRELFSTVGKSSKAALSALLLAAATVLGVGYVFTRAVTSATQRLCENSDYSVAIINPCTGPVGTTINLTLKRRLASPPATMVFKRVVANGVPAQVTTPVSGLSAAAPPQLCMEGGGRWEVWLVDAAGKSQGQIGVFLPDCRGVGGGANANGNANGGGGNGNGGGRNSNSGGGGGGGKGGGSGNKNGNNPGGGGSGTIDPCLVGTWEATSVKPSNPSITGGGEGFRVTFAKGGTETVDYTNMKPFQVGNDEQTYTGKATASISTQNKTAKLEGVPQSGVSMVISKMAGSPTIKLTGRLGPGGLGEAGGDTGYTCTSDSLEYQSSTARDRHANTAVKLRRVKE